MVTDPLPPLVIITPTPPPVLITRTPPLVLITPTPPPDPTSIPSSSSIPPSEIVTPSTDPDSAGDGEGVDLPFHDRPWIEPYGKGPWPTWGTIPEENRKPFWQCFQAQALRRAVHVDEVFAQTHVRKGTNEFVDERSWKTHEEFSMRLSKVRSEHGSVHTPDDARQLGANYTTSREGTLKHQPSSSTTTTDEAVVRLMQALEQRDQEITDLIAEFRNFKALVMRVLPETSQDQFIISPTQPRPSLSHAVPQQPILV
ncbi:hypothetical protein LR48_Vigan213s001100 [Vigna angularis]|uniref:Uncharacterized protein n=1 Tax=Phaseolus angularis TaxID=3914 RepID=A0A0L9T5Y9_PHAAN|nr:hypothetical protein LR48_Vigan213s001100 [Vigna angularis]